MVQGEVNISERRIGKNKLQFQAKKAQLDGSIPRKTHISMVGNREKESKRDKKKINPEKPRSKSETLRSNLDSKVGYISEAPA